MTCFLPGLVPVEVGDWFYVCPHQYTTLINDPPIEKDEYTLSQYLV